jgi:ribokinase
VPLHVVREALVCARAAGATTILNPAPAIGIDRSILALADIVTPNRNELATLLATEAHPHGRRTDSAQEVAERARLLIEDGPDGPGVRKAVIVTLGPSGVVVLERAGVGLEGAVAAAGEPVAGEPCDAAEAPPATVPTAAPPAPAGPAAIRVWEAPAEKVATIDSTGAGDAFNGALAAAIAEGRSLAEAVSRALVAGALATTHAGAREGMPTAQELEDYLAGR